MRLNFLILITAMFDLFSCEFDFPKPSDNWFATRIFIYESPAIDQSINQIYIVDEKTGFLLGDDFLKVFDKGGTEKDQSAYFFRSVDGGKSFEKQIFRKGRLDYISRSADGKTFYMIYAQFGEDDTIKPSNYQILKSTDMGKTWEYLYLFEDKFLTGVLFYNDTIGFASVLEEPIGYDIKVLYQTRYGGKTWKAVPVDIDNLSLNIITPEGKIMGRYVENEQAVWEMEIKDLIINKIPLDYSNKFDIVGFIQTDPVTNLHYVKLWTKMPEYDEKIKIECILLCIETGEKIGLPDYSTNFNIYGDYIGVRCGLKSNKYITQYYYSEDKGKTWKAETPKCIVSSAACGLYGKGYAWLTTPMEIDSIYCPLMVRIPQNTTCHCYYDTIFNINVYDIVDIYPDYNEGMLKFLRNITDSLSISQEDLLISKVVISIIIDENGIPLYYSINNKKEKEYSYIEREISDRIKKAGYWYPAKCENKNVTAILKIPVYLNFK